MNQLSCVILGLGIAFAVHLGIQSSKTKTPPVAQDSVSNERGVYSFESEVVKMGPQGTGIAYLLKNPEGKIEVFYKDDFASNLDPRTSKFFLRADGGKLEPLHSLSVSSSE